MFIPIASPVLAMNRTYNSLPACAICSLFNLANLKLQGFNIQSMEIRLHPHSLTVIQFNSYRLVSSNNSFNEVKLSSIHIFNSLKEKKINSVHIITVNRNEIYIYILSAWFYIMTWKELGCKFLIRKWQWTTNLASMALGMRTTGALVIPSPITALRTPLLICNHKTKFQVC